MSAGLAGDEIRERLQAAPGWSYQADHHLAREWRFDDFTAALEFLNRAAAVCEQLDHHADFELGWGRVAAKIWSHDINAVTERDFRLVTALTALDY